MTKSENNYGGSIGLKTVRKDNYLSIVIVFAESTFQLRI